MHVFRASEWEKLEGSEWRKKEKTEDDYADDDDPNDEDYAPDTDSDGEEAYEYESDDDLVGSDADEMQTFANDQHDRQDLLDWLRADVDHSEAEADVFVPLFADPDADDESEHGSPNPTDDDADDHERSRARLNHWLRGKLSLADKDENELEHVAGPGCVNTCGYSGHNISIEEMRNCRTSQCLVPKTESWTAESDDEDFESTSNYFLSGLCDFMPSRDMDYPQVKPARHGVEQPNAENDMSYNDPSEYALPFHPACFEIYKRASIQWFGHLKLDELFACWENDGYGGIIRDKSVDECEEQSWSHVSGTEWLVANPLLVPGWAEVLKDSKISAGMQQQQQLKTPSESDQDLFATLSPELRLSILEHLGSRDIANLRQVSRTFHHIPMSIFRGLVKVEMPWLWEAWSDQPYSVWATTTEKEVQERMQAKQDLDEQLREYRAVIGQEMPELLDMWRAAEPPLEQVWSGGAKGTLQPSLSFGEVDWQRLLSNIRSAWRKKQLRGLQNRQRIWRDCLKIIDPAPQPDEESYHSNHSDTEV